VALRCCTWLGLGLFECEMGKGGYGGVMRTVHATATIPLTGKIRQNQRALTREVDGHRRREVG
jgi:hypothetical protein